MRFPGERTRVVDGLAERGVGTLLYYPVPIHRQEYLQRIMPGAADLPLPVTNQLVDEIVSIPVRPSLTDEELATVVAAIREVATPSGRAARSRDRRLVTTAKGIWQPAGDGPLRIGLAGLGTMGRNHLRVISARTDATLVAVADPVPRSSTPPWSRSAPRASPSRWRWSPRRTSTRS